MAAILYCKTSKQRPTKYQCIPFNYITNAFPSRLGGGSGVADYGGGAGSGYARCPTPCQPPSENHCEPPRQPCKCTGLLRVTRVIVCCFKLINQVFVTDYISHVTSSYRKAFQTEGGFEVTVLTRPVGQ